MVIVVGLTNANGIGIILSRDEALQMRSYCKIEKRNSQQYIKYPCMLQKNNMCAKYSNRPFGCRLFPFCFMYDSLNGSRTTSIIMACPAAKDFYIDTNLFMQNFYLYTNNSKEIGKKRISIGDLELIKQSITDNSINELDLQYIKNKAKTTSV